MVIIILLTVTIFAHHLPNSYVHPVFADVDWRSCSPLDMIVKCYSLLYNLKWVLTFQVHENAYLSDFHHCFSLPSNSSGESMYEFVVIISIGCTCLATYF